MDEPSIFVAYTPRGAGLRCAIAYLRSERDIYGWFTGCRAGDGGVAGCYFLLENFFSSAHACYDVVDQQDLHSPWLLNEVRRHQLAQMQEAFAHEWLFYRDDPHAASQLRAYAEAELAAGEVNVRFDRLGKFSTLQPNWTCYSPRFERSVLRHLAKRWMLEYRPHPELDTLHVG